MGVCGRPELDQRIEAVVLGRVALDAGLAARTWPCSRASHPARRSSAYVQSGCLAAIRVS
jgi:hypothetical protein